MRRIVCLLSLVILATACGRAFTNSPSSNLKPGDFEQSIVVDGRKRMYTVHLPPSVASAQSISVVIVLHGGGGNGANAARMSGMSAKADQENFIAVYPDGSGRLGEILLTWNAGNCCGYALDQKIDDVNFIRALIDQLIANYPIDAKRVYVTGMSNGGMMSYRLGCELSDKIAAIAPVAGALNVDCKPTQPISVIAFHGTADQHVLYEGGAPQIQADPHPRVDQSVAYAMTFWSQFNKCVTPPKREDRSNIVHDTYTNCANGTAVELYAINNEGHTWPGGKSYLSGDTPTKEISATEVMWEFLKHHAKR